VNGGEKIFCRFRLKLCFASTTAEEIFRTLMGKHVTFRTGQEFVGRHIADRIMTQKFLRIVLELRLASGGAEVKFLAIVREDIPFGASDLGIRGHSANRIENLDGRGNFIFHG
jgi:hypothetical protein